MFYDRKSDVDLGDTRPAVSGVASPSQAVYRIVRTPGTYPRFLTKAPAFHRLSRGQVLAWRLAYGWPTRRLVPYEPPINNGPRHKKSRLTVSTLFLPEAGKEASLIARVVGEGDEAVNSF